MVLSVLSLSHLPHFFRVQSPLNFELFVVLVHLLLSSLILTLLVGETVLEDLVNLSFLLCLVHYFLERLRQGVLLQVVLEYSLLSNRSLTDFVQVYLFIV